eukprot:CAMPEP_0173393312 /NCGR_PEP_ID=MMETSP1356-20130122/22039_1 /TAXON_ID=77927 ORGANISM="Hemiselmis virescens, Strain PCC157" /NCGR_SAMPLE_ID=MMETSP1356 /ASSEMBLY_ACC=CAM_ASM_000847 /LENGTH=345 /DNA_ID=CAMNT_0014351315 /DNA_START=57 /DNA_END=1094 /DNA_ORIENTATION=-
MQLHVAPSSRSTRTTSPGAMLALVAASLFVGQAEASSAAEGIFSFADVSYLRGLGKGLIWPSKWRPVEHPPACGMEIDGPELPAFILIVGVLLGLGWVSRKARALISTSFGGVLGVYMSLLAFHIVTIDDAPYKGEFCFCVELFLFLLVPFLPAAFFSVLVRGGAVHGQTAKALGAGAMVVFSMMLFMSVNIGHEADHASDHRIWWLVAAQFLIPLWIVYHAIFFLLRLMGFRAGDKDSKSKAAGRGARVASMQRVLAGTPVTLHETAKPEGVDIPVTSTRSQQRRSSLTRSLGLETADKSAKKKTRRSKSPSKRRTSPGKKSDDEAEPPRRITRGSSRGAKNKD